MQCMRTVTTKPFARTEEKLNNGLEKAKARDRKRAAKHKMIVDNGGVRKLQQALQERLRERVKTTT